MRRKNPLKRKKMLNQYHRDVVKKKFKVLIK